ncbi:phosphopantothenoylcysteine synthetase/decarboxylase [Friedmanniella endophytica]|uniref:Phosphopantothenoylcysteine synthetase/decarboxylase n=1 Tax=Microlunatus kandeliicorticis TaxID=1759536 RepID=A0A7W3IRQ3_9ACTN|nr:flavoprotein [Microlunatus kandeliicorticis]MBA8794034.1 phosphopantothenoylcysteine synthetase/decarboxylase [Microlunatus kandeliicorticis]
MSTIGVIAAAAGGVETLRTGLVAPLIKAGHQVAVTLTPTAAYWLDDIGESSQLEQLTGYPIRSTSRLPGEKSPHPKIDVFLGAPMTANSVAKLAMGIADNQAMTVLCENIGTKAPMIIFPRINAAHSRQPAWNDHLERLRSAGVELAYGPDIWPLFEPRAAGPRLLPWDQIIELVTKHFAT